MHALLYDVHGNLPALEAVLADASTEGAERFLLGGDYAVFGAWPAETVERLRGLDAVWIRGNVDRWLVDEAGALDPIRPAIERCRELLGEEIASELAALPEQTVIGGTRYCHASPRSDMEGFSPAEDSRDGELLDAVTERRVVFGHTHLQFKRSGPDGVELVNPGSVGMPLDGDHGAAYALLTDDDAIVLRRVGYDWQASAAAIRDRLGDAGEIPARRLEAASIDI